MERGSSLVAQLVKSLSAMQETQVRFLGWEDPLEKEMATHSSMLAWKISWTESCSPWGCKESGTTERLTLTLIFKKPNFIIKLNYHITNKIRLIEEIFYWLFCARYFPPS